jgi:hypothetical protein
LEVAHRFDGRQVDAMLEWLNQHLVAAPAAKPRRRAAKASAKS